MNTKNKEMPPLKKGLVCVTGANGFIGAHVIRVLLKEGYTVRGTVRNANDDEKTQFLRDIARSLQAEARLSFASADLLTPGSFDDAFAGCDAVIHTAAVVDLTSNNPLENVVKPSILGTENVLRAIRKNASVVRLVHTSSIAAVMNMNAPMNTGFVIRFCRCLPVISLFIVQSLRRRISIRTRVSRMVTLTVMPNRRAKNEFDSLQRSKRDATS